MNIKKRLGLIKRDTAEIITEAELEKLLKEKRQPVIYHGFEPTGEGLHIGCMIGVNKHIDFQKAGLKLKLLLANLHAWLNEKASLSKVHKIANLYKEGFAALGVDMHKAEIIYGLDFQLGYDYFLDVLELALKVRLLRARRAMTLIGREDKDPHIAQLFYPLMQVVDMKALDVDIAFGDLAQRKIHMLAREHLPSIDCEAPVAIHHNIMVGLTGGKMSASVPASTIMIDEEPGQIEKKILAAFCPTKQVKDNPILQICKYIIFERSKKLKVERTKKYGGNVVYKNYGQLEEDYKKGLLHPLDLKKSMSPSLIKILAPARKHMSKPKIIEIKEMIKTLD